MEEIALENFQLIQLIDNGKVGKVYLTTDKRNGEQRALKVYPQTWSEEHFLNEVKCSKDLLGHPNIVKLLGFNQTNLAEQGGFLLMEYCGQGNLRQILHDHRTRDVLIDEPLRDKWIKELISGIEFIHSKDLIHRDIHPRNIMLQGNTIKIGGLRLIIGEESVDGKTRLNVTRYSSPEAVNMLATPENIKEDQFHRSSSDIWSYACIFYEIFTNKRVINEKTEMAIFKKLASSDFQIPALNTPSVSLNKLFSSMMSFKREDRPKAAVIMSILADPQAN